MRKHLFITVAVMALALSFGPNLMAEQGQAVRKTARVHVTENRPHAFFMFMDENGDGICDQFLDHDGDGIPNRQDPDWERPQDGNGNRYGRDGQQERGPFTHRNEFRESNGDKQNKRSFRYQRNQTGSPGGSGSGPNGNAQKRGGK